MIVKAEFCQKTTCACTYILDLQTCDMRNKVYQLKNEGSGITHVTESHQGLNKIINALKTPGSVKCLPVLFLISMLSDFMPGIDEGTSMK